MSKRLNKSISGDNSLLKYFGKSPSTAEKKMSKAPDDSIELSNGSRITNKEMRNGSSPKDKSSKRSLKLELEVNVKKDTKHLDGQRDDQEVPKKKRQRISVLDSDEEENVKDKTTSSNDSDNDSVDFSNNRSYQKIQEESKAEPKKKKSKTEKLNTSFVEKLQSLQEKQSPDKKEDRKREQKCENVSSTASLDEPVVWPHSKLEFLKPENIKDKAGRRPDHPDYDATTLYVPRTFLDSLSPAVRQWWVLKSENYDCILFFKVGKFYELYHMDADVGVNELGFTYMRGEFAHSGFPEFSFDKMASILIDRGYKVARVEQTETPEMMTERCKRIKGTKFDKVVRREICQVTNRGTQVFGSQCQITEKHEPNYMLSIVEKNKGTSSRYGICFIDTSIGDFYLGEFDDDSNSSRLLTLLAHHMPVLVLSEKQSLSGRSQEIFRIKLNGVLKEYLPPSGSHQCSAEKTLKHLAEKYYSVAGDGDNWPLVIRTMQNNSDHLGLTPDNGSKLALKALGLCIAYLTKCHLEEKVMPMARYNLYLPPDASINAETIKYGMDSMETKTSNSGRMRSHMVLDSITLANLRITGEERSLLSTLDNCCTKFGKRLLHHWVCSPSCDLTVIKERQEGITDLIQNTEVLQEMRALLAPLPDFERHLAQVHLFGNKSIIENHPDGRAIMFEEKQYNKKKIQNFIAVLKGFVVLLKIPEIMKNCNSALVKRLTQLTGKGGQFPDMSKHLEFFETAFNHEEAAKSGVIAPEKGVDIDYDQALNKIAKINEELKEYLVSQEKFFGCRIVYSNTERTRFQLEVPENAARKAGKEYSLEGQKKGAKPVRRFSTSETKNFLKQMQQAEEERDNVLKDLSRRIFERFYKHYDTWQQCVNCVAILDVLGSLAEYARAQQTICVPELCAGRDEQQFIDIAEGYHPCISAETYIPNGVILGTAGIAPLAILTGPNMGGKSTLMRQVGLLVIMAQIGCHVPAQHCKLSLVDRIFTRLGAHDDILAGQSTFLVELNETSSILKHATRNSLVLLDELGRGTATYDGTAIAASVVNYLGDLRNCTLFSTHYHNLIDFFHKDPRITLGHMACMVENEDTGDPTQETVTFLYKYTAGACPKSYGFNAAKLAGMAQPIIKRAYQLSKRVEAIVLKRKITAKIVAAASVDTDIDDTELSAIQNLLHQLKSCQIY